MNPTASLDTVKDSLKNVSSNIANNSNHEEGRVTRMIENQTAKVPSVGYLNLAIGSMVISAGLAFFSRKKEYANFVGLWAPSFMLMGIYNKLVKIEGSDKTDNSKFRHNA